MMRAHITAPAPRMLLRLIKLLSMWRKQELIGSTQSRICEIGPGLGDASSLALECFTAAEVHLYEGSAPARKLLQTRFTTEQSLKIYDLFSARHGYYEMVLCFEVIEHIREDQAFIDDIHYSMKAGGRLFGSVPAYMKKWQDVDELAGHFRRYEEDELHRKLLAAGFTDIQIYTYGFPLINLLYPLRKLYYGSLLKKRTNTNKDTATAKSGISRRLARSFNTPMVLFVVRFFSLFQSLPWLSHFGDGFVFSCKKM